MAELINKVAQSALVTLNLELLLHPGERVVYDIKENLFHGLILKEKEHALFVDDVLPSAKTIGQLALAKYAQNAFEDVAYYEPFYLKDVYITGAGKGTK